MQRREVLRIGGRGKVPSTFDLILGKSVLARDKTHRLRTSIDPSSNKLHIRTIPNTSKVVLPDGSVADQLRLDVRDIGKLGEIVRKFGQRRGLSPLTDGELDKLIADAESNAIEIVNPEVVANVAIDLIGFKKCLVKIAYELAFCWLGEEYLDDPVAKGTREYLNGIIHAKDTTAAVLPMKGIVSFDVIDSLKMWSDNRNLHIAYATQLQGSVVISIKIFDIFYATFVVSDMAEKYLAMGLSDQKLRFLAIDPVTKAMAETSFMEEVGRIARIMIGREPKPVPPRKPDV